MPVKSLAAYKNRPALVQSREGDKLIIAVGGGGDSFTEFKVREKDLQFLHAGPCGLSDIAALGEGEEGPVREAWELAEASGQTFSLGELAELIWGTYSPQSAWAVFLLLKEGLYFSGDLQAIRPRPAADVEAEQKKRSEKGQESRERAAFLERLRGLNLELPGDSRFLQDVEALAYGRTEKSRTLRDAGLEESPVRAHRLLLETGFWDASVNPHPFRFGLSLSSASPVPDPPPPEDRLDLGHLPAFAIDNPWSEDPDDAVSLESPDSGAPVLWVHVADPASSIGFDSAAEKEARGRGATFYLPEGTYRMIADEALPLFALGLAERSPALSFKLTLNSDASLAGAEVIPSWVRVQRMSYEEADASPDLKAFFALGERNLARRLAAGAVSIELPELHIRVQDGQVRLENIPPWKSAAMVRECMLLAGEGAAWWAARRAPELLGGRPLPFPYVGQELGDLPADPLPGYAGSWQLRKSMRPRSLSLKPSLHQGLGLDVYTQITSPLRRYTDLLAHQQIRAVLRGLMPLGEDDVLLRMGAGEVAMAQSVHAERASRTHWTLVYLRDKIGSRWEGVVVEKRGAKAHLLIPALGLDTQVNLKTEVQPNETVPLSLVSLRIPEGEAVFSAL
ncbi:MAG: RNB domain-containing ribonuclease [Treponema sp.]|jgi:exoribonuclease-2|nr:RNB domain-containing ribonuclease [Treponema sp.]